MKDFILDFAKEFVIYDTNLEKKRIGRNQDGGYVVASEPSKQTDVLYSYGVSDDWSFEQHFADEFQCPVRLYDHTVDLDIQDNDRLTFKKQGLSPFPTPQTNSIESHIIDNSDFGKRISLKIDIEWNEWDFFYQIDHQTLTSFNQIICEFHVIPVAYSGQKHTPYFQGFHRDVYGGVNQEIFKKYTKVFQKINQNYILFHAHVNNSLDVFEYKNSKIPFLLECSFVNKKNVSWFEKTSSLFPIQGLDFPNKPYKNEIENFYPFIK